MRSPRRCRRESDIDGGVHANRQPPRIKSGAGSRIKFGAGLRWKAPQAAYLLIASALTGV